MGRHRVLKGKRAPLGQLRHHQGGEGFREGRQPEDRVLVDRQAALRVAVSGQLLPKRAPRPVDHGHGDAAGAVNLHNLRQILLVPALKIAVQTHQAPPLPSTTGTGLS